MTFRNIYGGHCTYEEKTIKILTCPVFIGERAKAALKRLGETAAKERIRGMFKDGERWVAFEGAEYGVLVEDFELETLAYAWLFLIKYGYFHVKKGVWCAFTTPSTVPEHRYFSTRKECIEFLKK